MCDFVHGEAFYINSEGVRIRIRAKDLEDRATFEQATQLTLYDGAEQLRLYPRQPDGVKPHFFAPPTTIKRRIHKFEENSEHDRQIDKNLKKLLAVTNWKVAIRKYGAPSPEILFELDNYQWGTEIHRIVSADGVVRHDIFGKSSCLEMSVRRPWVAIEVINTHFPEETTFDALLSLSNQLPLLVLFDLTEKPGYFLTIKETLGLLLPIYYIHDGVVWKGRTPTDIRSSRALELAMSEAIKKANQKKAPLS